jgi:hypothetical protein
MDGGGLRMSSSVWPIAESERHWTPSAVSIVLHRLWTFRQRSSTGYRYINRSRESKKAGMRCSSVDRGNTSMMLEEVRFDGSS